MKKLILLLSIIAIGYACQKPKPIEPIPFNKVYNQQSQCGWDGTYVADSVATAQYAIKWNTIDTIVNLTSQIIYLGDTTFNTGVTACKYQLDTVTQKVNYLSYGTTHNINIAAFNYKYDTLPFLTKTNKVIILVKQ